MDILDFLLWITAVLGGLSMLRGAVSLYEGFSYLDDSIQKTKNNE